MPEAYGARVDAPVRAAPRWRELPEGREHWNPWATQHLDLAALGPPELPPPSEPYGPPGPPPAGSPPPMGDPPAPDEEPQIDPPAPGAPPAERTARAARGPRPEDLKLRGAWAVSLAVVGLSALNAWALHRPLPQARIPLLPAEQNLPPARPEEALLSPSVRDCLGRARAGDPRSMRLMGDFFLHGVQVPQDREQALRWYRRAAGKGDPEARRRLRELDGEEAPLSGRSTGR